MKALTFSALALSLLAGCATQPVTALRMPAPVNQMAAVNTFSQPGIRSDEGLRKGVIELRKVRFQKWDKNMDGAIVPDEVKDVNMSLPGVIAGFDDYDANHDGKIVMDEFLREDVIQFWMNLIRPKLEELFAKHDSDGNWLLTADEQAKLKLFFSPWPSLKGGDLNGDGVVTFSEFEDAYMTVLPFFQQANRDLSALPQS